MSLRNQLPLWKQPVDPIFPGGFGMSFLCDRYDLLQILSFYIVPSTDALISLLISI